MEGTDVKVTRVAIANPVVVAPGEGDPQLGLAIDSASGSVGGTGLTVAFTGAPDPGDKPCGEDYTAEAVESDLAVVVIVTRHPHATVDACTLAGAPRTATATLAAPLGDRVVLDFQQGDTPVPVVLAPLTLSGELDREGPLAGSGHEIVRPTFALAAARYAATPATTPSTIRKTSVAHAAISSACCTVSTA